MKSLPVTAVSASFVNKALEQSRCRNQILLLDSCFSEAFANEMVRSRGRVLITATDSIRYALEGEEGGTPSTRPAAWEEGVIGDKLVTGVFTNAIIKGLEKGHADLNSDGKITATELYNYVYGELSKKSDMQTPRLWAYDLAGDILLAENCCSL
jgi:uncharacterized caspase-like protein